MVSQSSLVESEMDLDAIWSDRRWDEHEPSNCLSRFLCLCGALGGHERQELALAWAQRVPGWVASRSERRYWKDEQSFCSTVSIERLWVLLLEGIGRSRTHSLDVGHGRCNRDIDGA